LVRYTGHEFEIFSHPDLWNNQVTRLSTSPTGNLTFTNYAGEAGEVVYQEGLATVRPISGEKFKDPIRLAINDHKGVSWLVGLNIEEKSAKYNVVYKVGEAGKFQTFRVYPGLNLYNFIWQVKDSSLWLFTRKSSTFEGLSLQRVQLEEEDSLINELAIPISQEGIATPYYSTYTQTSSGIILIVGPDNLFQWKGDSVKAIDIQGFDFSGVRIHSFAEAKNPESWLATSKGLVELKKIGPEEYEAMNIFLEGKVINSIFVDRDNNLWIGTEGEGLFLLPHDRYLGTLFESLDKDFRKPQSTALLPNNYLGALCPDGRLLIGNGATWNMKSSIQRFGYSKIVSNGDSEIVALSNGQSPGLLASLENGIPSSNEVSLEIKTLSVNNLKAATWNNGVWWLGNSRFLWKIKDDSLVVVSSKSRIISLYGDKFQDFIWVGSNRGLGFVSNEIFSSEYLDKFQKSLPYNIQSFAQMPDSTLIMGTRCNGLWGLRSDSLFSIHDKLNIKAIAFRELLFYKGYLWVLSDKGLLKVHVEKNHAEVLAHYTSEQFQEGLDLEGYKDQIWLTTSNGIYSFSIEQPYHLTSSPTVNLLHFEGTNDKGIISQSRSLPPGYDEVKIKFAGMSFAERLTYEYQLRPGLPWIKLETPSINLSALRHGKYHVRVRAIRPSGVMTAEPLSVPFEILPYFWQTTWFKSIIALAVLLLTAILIGEYYRRKIKRAFIAGEQEKEIIRSKLAALRAQMNPHFVFNSLTSIQQFFINDDRKNALRYMSDFARLIRQTFEHASYEQLTLGKEITFLKLYIELEKKRFRKEVELSFIVDEELDLEMDRIPPLLIQPIVENTFQHGFVHTQKEGTLTITLKAISASLLEVRVEDNGIGFHSPPDFCEIAGEDKSGSPSGMKVVATRLDLLGKRYSLPLSIHIQELVDPLGDPVGTEVILIIPRNL